MTQDKFIKVVEYKNYKWQDRDDLKSNILAMLQAPPQSCDNSDKEFLLRDVTGEVNNPQKAEGRENIVEDMGPSSLWLCGE